eukprot:TRINITY_DN47058_c0_g1_i1.p1 TRINITY_DN47058_c0_g1~~TRINITY_DN47058_c0_g1_i1.p1  ORF type:complete len:666 (+),score=224.59 TRINITY_DN47058_c0_g1_i1:113-1999(+)
MALMGLTKVAEGKFMQSATIADKHGEQSRKGISQAKLRESEENQGALVAGIERTQDEWRAEIAMQRIYYAEADFEEQKVLVLLQGIRAISSVYHQYAWIAGVCLGSVAREFTGSSADRVHEGHRWAFWTFSMVGIFVLMRVILKSKFIVLLGTELAFQGTMGITDVRRAFHGVLQNRGHVFWWLLGGFVIFNLQILYLVYIELHEGSDLSVLRTMSTRAYVYGAFLFVFVWAVTAVRMWLSWRSARKDFAFTWQPAEARYGETMEITERDMMPQRSRGKKVGELIAKDAWARAYADCSFVEVSLRKDTGQPLPVQLYELPTRLPVVEVTGIDQAAQGAESCAGVVGWHLVEVMGVSVVDMKRPLVPEIQARCVAREVVTLRFAQPPERALGHLNEWSDRACGTAYTQCIAGAAMLQFDRDGDERLNQAEFHGFFSLIHSVLNPGSTEPPPREQSDARYHAFARSMRFPPEEGMARKHVARVLRRAPPGDLDRVAQLLGVPPQGDTWRDVPAGAPSPSAAKRMPYGVANDSFNPFAPPGAATERSVAPSGLTARGVGGMQAGNQSRRGSGSEWYQLSEPENRAPAPSVVTSFADNASDDVGWDHTTSGHAMVSSEFMHQVAAGGAMRVV